MPIRIRYNAQQVQLVTWPPRPGEGPSWLRDTSSLRNALRDAVAEPGGSAELREMLIQSGASGVQRADDQRLIELAIGLIQDGRMMLLPPEWRWRPRLMVSVIDEASAPPAEQAAKKAPPAKTFFAIKIVDEKTGDPVSSVRLKITTPDGVEDYQTTSPGGTIRMNEIPQGTCDVACDLTGATMQDSYEFKGEGQPPPPPDPTKVWPSNKISASNLKRIVEIVRHKVTDKDSIDSLAKANGLDWKFLSRFNWGTDVPVEINKHLRSDNGIWKPTADGKNWSFTATDHPGIMFIPKKWEKTGMSTGVEHVIKIRHIVPFHVRLETMRGNRIPEAKYAITWANKDTKEGQLGPQGIDMIEDPPPGKFKLEYKDLHEVLAKGLAADARAAMDKGTQGDLLQILKYDKEATKNLVKFYDQYFNTYTGKGFIEDLYKKFPSQDERDVLEFLLATNAQEIKEEAQVIEPLIYTPLEIETDNKFGKVGALTPGSTPEGGTGG